jgi:hypothetical protein
MKRLAVLAGHRTVLPVALFLLLGLGSAMAEGQYAKIEIVVKDKKFRTGEVKAPANARNRHPGEEPGPRCDGVREQVAEG